MGPVDDVAMPFLLMSAFRALVDAVHRDLAAAGLPDVRASHGFAMQAIGTGCTSVQLGERLGVSKQAAAKTARSLEEMGFVTRAASGTDRRERIVTPTERGETMLALSAEAFRREVHQWRSRAGDTSVDTTLTTLGLAPRGRRGPTDLSDWT